MSRARADREEGRTKVAILGGGCGGLAAAWSLTATPALRRRFEVTVYQAGWQLGGKGASGRRLEQGGGRRRIEEHGLHIWFGFYERAFRMLRAAYAESGLADGDAWWTIPFEKCDAVCLYEQRPDGTWLRQPIHLPRRGAPGRGPPTESRRPPLGRVLARTTRLLASGMRTELGEAVARRGGGGPRDSELAAAAATLDQIAREIEGMDSPVALDADGGFAAVSRGLRPSWGRPPQDGHRSAVETLLGKLHDQVRAFQSELAERVTSDRIRLWWGILELVAASLAGIVGDEVLRRGFDPLDQEDLREWLGRHGASRGTLARSPVLRGLYDLTFAYRDGDKQRPSLAAGKGLQSLLMMINYEGSFMWRMRAGMGDVVFAPLYLALRRRGVRFEFFSHVTRLRLMPGQPVIQEVELIREAKIVAGAGRYEPIERIGDWWCWPATAYREQLGDEAPRTDTLRRGVDFDDVVLAIPVGALSDICGELADANPRFKQMLAGARTVRTKAFQVWLTRPIDELRGPSAAEGLDPPATAYEEPFDTYCDMSHLLPAEGDDRDGAPKGVAYFCAVLPDAATDAEAERSVRGEASRYLERAAAAIWPQAFHEGRFDWSVVFDPLEREGRERLGAQYFRANLAGTDRYVTTPAGSVDSRLDPDESGFENLVLAGDWTHNGIDGGCVEAAVISGERAAEAIVARPPAPESPRPAPESPPAPPESPPAPPESRTTAPELPKTRPAHRSPNKARYIEYGALATAPGPLLCERARLYCFFVQAQRERVQHLCDRVLRQPTGGALRYRVPRLAPVVLTFGTIAGLRSLHPAHSDRGSASEPEAAIWVPTVAQRHVDGRYLDDHLAIFMPYIWVDDPVAFASGREVYGFAKTQGWMRRLDDPRAAGGAPTGDPPEELVLDVYGAADYEAGAELGRRRLLTVRRSGPRRGGRAGAEEARAEGTDLASLVGHFMSELDPSPGPELGEPVRALGPSPGSEFGEPVRRSPRPLAAARARVGALGDLVSEQAVRHVFLKQFRDAEDGERAVLQQVVEARSSVTPGSLRWRRLRGAYDLSVAQLASHPLQDELGLAPEQTIRWAFVSEFGFRMEPGVVRWP